MIWILVCGVLLFAGCAGGEAPAVEAPAATQIPPPQATLAPALRVADIPAASTLPGLTEIQYETWAGDGVVRGWWDSKWLTAGGVGREFTNVLVDGKREGNRVFINLAQEETEEFIIGGVYLYTADGREGFMPVITTRGQYRNECRITFADLDGDGTDEIILLYDVGATSGEGDLHVFSYQNGELAEPATLLTQYDRALREVYKDTLRGEESCVGARVVQGEGGLLLRVFLYADSADFQEVRYEDWAFREGALQPRGETVVMTGQAQKAFVQSLLPNYPAGEEDYAYRDFRGTAVKLRGAMGAEDAQEDLLYVHTAYTVQPEGMHLLLEAEAAGGERTLLRTVSFAEMGGYNYVIADMDQDGYKEVFLVFHFGDGVSGRLEMQLLRLRDGVLEELLLFENTMSELLQPGKEAAFRLPLLAAGLPFADAQALNAAVQWAQPVPYGDGYAIDLEHFSGSEHVMTSRIAPVNGVWTLVEQGPVAAGEGEGPQPHAGE